MADIDFIASRLISAYDRAETLEPFTSADPDFDMAQGYAVQYEIQKRRRAQGWQPVGRKIGFTNRSIWPRYNVDRPLWAHVWSRTLHFAENGRAEIALAPFVQPRIEPEVVFKLRANVPVTDDPYVVLDSVEWIAAGFEIVQSHFPDWKFKAPDCAAGFGLHGALIVGSPVAVDANSRRALVSLLESFTLTLRRGDQVMATGTGAVVLGNPALTISHLAGVLAQQPQFPALAAGEIVTTGTLTDALPIIRGETWSSDYGSLGVSGIGVLFR
jgi:2-keto-4-pentenoate hydratase